MARRGAQSLILLSRAGPKSQAALTLLKELQTLSIQVESPQCDVSSLSSLPAALSSYVSMDHIKGCLQSTIELKDGIFDNMSFEDWTTSIKSKVHSSHNFTSFFAQTSLSLSCSPPSPASPAPPVRPTTQPATPTKTL